MRSIRAQLLGWLLPAFLVVFTVANVGVYYSAKLAIDADLDVQLSRLAGSARLALRNQVSNDSRGPRTPGLRAFLAKEEFQFPGQYFQVWASEGFPGRRSPNLGQDNLPRAPDLTREAVRYDGNLENGEPVRVSAMQYPQGGGGPPLDFAVAVSRREGEGRLSRLLVELTIGGLGCCILLCLLLVLALRFALRPLVRVGEQAAAMGAGSLHERFAMEALPLEITPIVGRLNALLGRLQQGFERERRFTGDLAHELRTPLAAIRATSEVAEKWPEQSSSDDFHEITLAATRLQQTVDSLLLLSRVETASADVSCQRVAFRPLIEECIALYTEQARQRDLRWNLRLHAEPFLETDPRLLRIIVTNLIANAVEYAPARTELVIDVESGDTFLNVSNLAPELTSEDIHLLFDRLWRKDATRGEGAHSGLGLSIAQSCAQVLKLGLSAQLHENGVIQISLYREK